MQTLPFGAQIVPPPDPRLQRTSPPPLSRKLLGRNTVDMGRAVAAGVLLFLASNAASADSDGCFCWSEGYLAYELREWSAPEGRHVLKIIRVGGLDGLSDPITLSLDNFQVHGMKCEPAQIVVLAWDKEYTVNLLDRSRPRTKSVEPVKPGRRPDGFRVDSLTNSRQSGSVAIPSSDPKRTYELQIAHREQNRTTEGKGGVVYHTTISRLVERDLGGKILREKLIYEGVAEETVD